MRQKFLILLVGLLSLNLALPAEAVIRAGSKCTKLNSTSTVAGRKYTCIKSGGKLIWNRGVIVNKGEALTAGVCPQFSATDANIGISVSRASTLIGMRESDGESCASKLRWIYRVTSRDGEDFPATLDFRLDRISVTIKNGIISRVDVG